MSVKKFLMGLPFYDLMVIPYHYVRAGVSVMKYGFPARGMRVIGVTGTNGKTTTCFMIWKMLREAGFNAGVMTTVGWGADKIHKQVEHMTTESAEILNKRMRELCDAGVEVLVLEVTSHALAQGRIFGVPIEVAVMTNVTHEHLDYHKTFARYVAAKCKLFTRAKFGVVNADDENFKRFLAAMGSGSGGADVKSAGGGGGVRRFLRSLRGGKTGKDYASYGIKNGDFRAFDVKLEVSGVNYACGDIKVLSENGADVRGGDLTKNVKCVLNGGCFEIKTRIPGKFNVYNSLAAVCVGRYFGLADKQISDGIYALTEVEGRMNLVEEGQDFKVLVDYAHTPDAIAKVFEAMGGGDGDNDMGDMGDMGASDRSAGRGDKKQGWMEKGAKKGGAEKGVKKGGAEERGGRIIVVHGGAGRRDESTRRMRGEIIGRNADVFIVTEDDTRDENLEEICAEFVRGAEGAGMEFFGSFEEMMGSTGADGCAGGAGAKADDAGADGCVGGAGVKAGDGARVVKKRGCVIFDRKEAIFKAIEMARKGDVVMILGKGHEKTILRANGAEEFEDLKVAREGILRKIQKKGDKRGSLRKK